FRWLQRAAPNTLSAAQPHIGQLLCIFLALVGYSWLHSRREIDRRAESALMA
ncbi:hypothetical protein EMPG_17465, partial [Blastomyces silverae]